MKPFDPTKPVTTRDGRKVRILISGLPARYPITGFIEGVGEPLTWNASGSIKDGGENSVGSLINPPEKVWRPWTPEEAAKHVGEKVKSANGHVLCATIESVSRLNGARINGGCAELQDVFKHWVFMDGTPCGVETEAA